jgi:hypothetical protein
MAEHYQDGRMEGLDYWRLCDELSVHQAALLIAGCDPSTESNAAGNPDGYEPAKTAISNALQRGAIKGRFVPLYRYDFDGNREEIEHSIDISNSQVEVDALRTWLAGRGLKTGFFFPETIVAQDYLDPKNPRYAPKLAAAVFAWMATANEAATSGKSPKQALVKWLREHAADFGLTDDDGKPNETGIEEAAKVSNWQPTGGAPKTPGG